MMFQFGGSATGVMQFLQNWGVIDGLLPFLLLFTLMFAILTKIGVFGDRKIAAVISGTISALIVIPHMVGGIYPAGFDPIVMINQMLPSAGILLVAILLVLMMIGLVGGDTKTSGGWVAWVVTIAIGILLLSIISAIWPSIPIVKYLFADASLVALVIVILVFGLIVWFVTKEPLSEKEKEERKDKTITKALQGLLGASK